MWPLGRRPRGASTCRIAQWLNARTTTATHATVLPLVPHTFSWLHLQAVIDLGAAPGAWSELLAQRAERVVAVDPAQLSENCAALPNVHHVRKASQDAVADVRQALGGGEADIIVCDMIQPPHFCADCIRPLLPLLRAGGHVVMTCKFIGHARDRCAVVAACPTRTKGTRTIHDLRWLPLARAVAQRLSISAAATPRTL